MILELYIGNTLKISNWNRDLKSDNIMLHINKNDNRFTTKVIDFDHSREIAPEMSVFIGTELWAAPEIILAQMHRREMLHYTTKADVYSFAIIMWQLIYQSMPYEEMRNFTNKKKREVIASLLRPQTDLESIDPALQYMHDIMEISWSGDPNYRPTFSSLYQLLSKEYQKLKKTLV